MQHKKTIYMVLLIVMISMFLMACSNQSGASEEAGTEPKKVPEASAVGNMPFLVFKDHTGEEVVLNKKPERIVILNTQLLQLFDDLGGVPIGIATGPDIQTPVHAKSAKEVGLINQVNIEEILSLKPDLVIGQSVFHPSLRDTMKEANIPFALTAINTVEDIRNTALLLGQIIDQPEETNAKLAEMDERIQQIVNKVPKEPSTFVLLSLAKNILYIKTNTSIALDIAAQLNLDNQAKNLQTGSNLSSAPFSMEKLVELDPQHLFVIVSGPENEAAIRKDLEKQEAWASLTAVKKQQLYFIPTSLFVNNPGLSLEKSFDYMAKAVYPNIEGKE